MKINGVQCVQYDPELLSHNQDYSAFDEDWESIEEKRNKEFDRARSILSLDEKFIRNSRNFRK